MCMNCNTLSNGENSRSALSSKRVVASEIDVIAMFIAFANISKCVCMRRSTYAILWLTVCNDLSRISSSNAFNESNEFA